MSELVDDDAAGPGHVVKLRSGGHQDGGQSSTGQDNNTELSKAYESCFALVDVLCAPANLPRICSAPGDRMPWLRTDVRLRDYQLEGEPLNRKIQFFFYFREIFIFEARKLQELFSNYENEIGIDFFPDFFCRHHLVVLLASIWSEWHSGG